MRHAALALPITLAALVATTGGCGGSSGPTKEEFIARGDAICKRVDAKQKAAKRDFWNTHPGVLGTRQFREEEEGWRTDVVESAVLPQVQEEAEELNKLPRPTGDKATIHRIVLAMKEAVRVGEKEPVALVGKNAVGPFGKVEGLAWRYGFEECADPL
jgi:hypothetical protein